MKNIVLSLALSMVLFSCGKEETRIEKETISIEVLEASASPLGKQYDFSGIVTSADKTILSTKVMGQVEMIREVGTTVKKGELIVRIKNKELTSRLASAEAGFVQANASLENTEKNYQRIYRLFEKGSATQKEMDDISTQLAVQKAQVESARQGIAEIRELISYSQIISPIDGFVSEKFINASDMANPGRPIIALESLGNLEVEIRVPEFEIGLFEVGKEIEVEFKTAKNTVNARVERIVPSSEFSGAQYLVKASLPQTTEIKPGMFAHVSLVSGKHEKIIIPNEIIHKRGQLTGVYTINQQGESMLRWVRLGKSYPEGTEVISGLESGEKVITAFDGKPAAGLKVEIKNNQ